MQVLSVSGRVARSERGYPMKKLSVDLTYCYGIRRMEHEFDFASSRQYAIYAPNGAMKTSFAKVFEDISRGNEPADLVFPNREAQWSIQDENGDDVSPEQILVVRSYDENARPGETTATLLVDANLRKEYEKLWEAIRTAKANLLAVLKKHTKSKLDIEAEVSKAFTSSSDQMDVALGRVRAEVENHEDNGLDEVEYDLLFSPRSMEVLQSADVQGAIQDYIERYNELLDNSAFFQKGTFDHFNAETVAKSLEKNGFFKAKHTVRLQGGEAIEVTDTKQLTDLIRQEQEAIAKDPELLKAFQVVDKLFSKNEAFRSVREYLSKNPDLLARLENLEQLREDVWKAVLAHHKGVYLATLGAFEESAKRRKEIENEAMAQHTAWEEVIEIFNQRFIVPFTLDVKNRLAVMLGNDTIPQLSFKFVDAEGEADVDKDSLLQVLSNGEKRALFLLNLIFEIEARRKNQTPTLFILDDVADSFDYKNKYAIVQYLMDISEEPAFQMLVLTHNFDFLRTLESRLVRYNQCLMSSRSDAKVELLPAAGIKNIYANDWKGNFEADDEKRVASIPFLRNMVEYTLGSDHPDFLLLTSLLHVKPTSTMIPQSDLDAVYNRLHGTSIAYASPAESVFDMIFRVATAATAKAQSMNLAEKLALAIGSRLKAEQFMINQINDSKFHASITRSQTWALFSKYKGDFPAELSKHEVLQRVVLMTPEHIHLNSFMYEPIVDMDDSHLRKLFTDVTALTTI